MIGPDGWKKILKWDLQNHKVQVLSGNAASYLVEFDHGGNEISHKEKPDAPIKLKCPGSKFVSVFRGETPVSQF